MPLINKEHFEPDPIPNLNPDEEVFYFPLTNEIFTNYNDYFERFIHCQSLVWSCSKTKRSGLTFQEALESEEGKSKPPKKKKKKYPYDPKKYSMPVPEGFDPDLLTPTGKIDGRKLKSKKNQALAEELLAKSFESKSVSPNKKQQIKQHKIASEEKEKAKKAKLLADQAKERELESKRRKEAAILAKQLEKQKKEEERQRREEERKKAASFLQEWDKKCEDLERDDLRRLPQPTPVNCEIPEKLFGDAVYIMESFYNFHELYNIKDVCPDGISFDVLEEILFEKDEESPLGTIVQFLLTTIFNMQPTGDGYGIDEVKTSAKQSETSVKSIEGGEFKDEDIATETDPVTDEVQEGESMNSENGDDEEHDNGNMNDLIGSAIKAAQEVKQSLRVPLPEMEMNSTTVTEILRLHLLQSGSFPKGRTIYNGWYSSREDPGLWLCMQEPDLIKKLGETTIYNLEIEERIKILHTLIYQLLSFIKTRLYIEAASEQLTELRKEYRRQAAEFARWDRENCVKRMHPPKRKIEDITSEDRSNQRDVDSIKLETNGEVENGNNDFEAQHIQLKSCLKTENLEVKKEDDNINSSKKKISFKTKVIDNPEQTNGDQDDDQNQFQDMNGKDDGHTFEDLDRAYQQNVVDYEDYQREKAFRHDQLDQILLDLRNELRSVQSIYGVHPVGRDRAYRRYWLFQSLPGLFVEHDDDYIGVCLDEPTPQENRYKKLFNKENPQMHPTESDLYRNTPQKEIALIEPKLECSEPENTNGVSPELKEDAEMNLQNGDESHSEQNGLANDGDADDDIDTVREAEQYNKLNMIRDEMNYCTGNNETCAVHGSRKPPGPKWWFYHSTDQIDSLVECLNKRGYRESELLETLSAEKSIIKEKVGECPSFKLNRHILEQSGIRRSRRIKTRGNKRRPKNFD